jgi:hypothetical protein
VPYLFTALGYVLPYSLRIPSYRLVSRARRYHPSKAAHCQSCALRNASPRPGHLQRYHAKTAAARVGRRTFAGSTWLCSATAYVGRRVRPPRIGEGLLQRELSTVQRAITHRAKVNSTIKKPQLDWLRLFYLLSYLCHCSSVTDMVRPLSSAIITRHTGIAPSSFDGTSTFYSSPW